MLDKQKPSRVCNKVKWRRPCTTRLKVSESSKRPQEYMILNNKENTRMSQLKVQQSKKALTAELPSVRLSEEKLSDFF